MAASISQVSGRRKRTKTGKMPVHGWTPVTVPGAPMAWAELSRGFGRLPLSQALAPAVRYAREGYPCSPNLARHVEKRPFTSYQRTCTGSRL